MEIRLANILFCISPIFNPPYCILFRGVICCSGGLYAVQVGYMDVQEGYMMKKIMMILVDTNIVASRPTEHRPTGMPTACAFFGPKFFASKDFVDQNSIIFDFLTQKLIRPKTFPD